MRISTVHLFACFAFMLVFAQASMSQNDLPKALLHENENSDAPASRKYYIEVETKTPLKSDIFKELCHDTDPAVKCASKTRIGILSSKGVQVDDSGDNPFDNTLLIARDDGNAAKHYRIYLPASMAPFTDFADQKYSIVLTNFVDTSGDSAVRVIPVGLATLTRTLSTDFSGCRRNEFAMSVDYDSSATKEHLLILYKYLESLRDPDKFQKIKIEVEPLTRKGTKTLTVKAVTTVAPVRNKNGDDPLFGNFSKMFACFSTDGDVPTEKFDARLTLPDAPVDLVEPTVVTGLTALSAEPASDVFPQKEKAVGVRPIDKDLNVGFSLVSSVKDEQQPDKTTLRKRNTIGTLDLRLGFLRDVKSPRTKHAPVMASECGPIGDYTPASGSNPAILIINGHTNEIAPGVVIDGDPIRLKGGEACLYYKYTDELTGAITEHSNDSRNADFRPLLTTYKAQPVTSGTFSIFTPFYIDAKVSTGRITTDTSSLNRVVFGAQEELRYYQNNHDFPTYYRFVFQANHAADRDFKQREFDGTFKFYPVFAALNHPFDLTMPTQRRAPCVQAVSHPTSCCRFVMVSSSCR